MVTESRQDRAQLPGNKQLKITGERHYINGKIDNCMDMSRRKNIWWGLLDFEGFSIQFGWVLCILGYFNNNGLIK